MAEMERVITSAIEARAVGVTRLNQNSSRRHCIFTIILTQYTKQSSDVSKGKTLERQSHINLIDLAGSERVTAAATKQTTTLYDIIIFLKKTQAVLAVHAVHTVTEMVMLMSAFRFSAIN